MSYIKPVFNHPLLPKNELGYTRKDYEGTLSTLCAGCGHDSISAAISEACFEVNIEPHRLAKMSGIGCSSKTPAYFLSHSHGFNSVHGRMPSVATGAGLANTELKYLGVSGDGDTASIGMGQFCHVIRRNLNMVYIVMNNGCYGLTKGQDSATADKGSIAKAGNTNTFEGIDLCSLSIELGASFVAQSFSGDKKQLIPILKAALMHKGFAFINIISPCVTFNNNQGSTKSYDYVREHNQSIGKLDFVPIGEEIIAESVQNETQKVALHDGSPLYLTMTDQNYDATNKMEAMNALYRHRDENKILTGLLYFNANNPDLAENLNMIATPLNQLKEEDLCPGNDKLVEINAGFR